MKHFDFIRQFLSKQVDELNTRINELNAGAGDTATAGLKSALTAMRKGYEELLAKMPTLDAVPAALEASGSLNWLGMVIERLKDSIDDGVTKLSDMKKKYEQATGELNELKTKVGAEYVTKAVSQAAVETAVQNERNALQPQIAAIRKDALVLAGIPLPEEKAQADKILNLPLAEYNAATERAKGNIELLKKRGLKLGGKGEAFVRSAAWMSETEFNGSMATLKDLVPGEAAGGEREEMLGGEDPRNPKSKGLPPGYMA